MQALSRLLSFCCWTFLLIVDTTRADENIEVARFKRLYDDGARQLEERFRNIRLTGTLYADDGHGRARFLALENTVLRELTAFGDSLYPETSPMEKHYSHVFRVGPDYLFRLAKRREADPFYVTTLEQVAQLEGSGRQLVAAHRELRIEQFLKAPFFLYGKAIRDWLEAEQFRVKSAVRKQDPSDKTIVEVDVAITFPDGRAADSARFVFLPDLMWTLSESEVRFTLVQQGRTIRGAEGVRISYDSSRANEQGVPDKVELYKKDVDTGKGSTRYLTIEAVEFGTVQPHELTLAAFGLSDVREPTPKRVGLWVWFAAAGGALLVVAALFGWLKTRTRSRVTR